MGNRLEGTASFEYEGQEYHLTLNNRVLIEAEEVLGYSALDAAEEARVAMQRGMRPKLKTVAAIFYGAIIQQHPGLTEDNALDMFLGDDREPLEAFKKILVGIVPPEPVGNGTTQNAAKPKRGTGKQSSVRTAKRVSAEKSSS